MCVGRSGEREGRLLTFMPALVESCLARRNAEKKKGKKRKETGAGGEVMHLRDANKRVEQTLRYLRLPKPGPAGAIQEGPIPASILSQPAEEARVMGQYYLNQHNYSSKFLA